MTFIYYNLYGVVVIIHDSHVSAWWLGSQDGRNFFFPIFFSLFFFCMFAFKYYIFIIADILEMILWLY